MVHKFIFPNCYIHSILKDIFKSTLQENANTQDRTRATVTNKNVWAPSLEKDPLGKSFPFKIHRYLRAKQINATIQR